MWSDYDVDEKVREHDFEVRCEGCGARRMFTDGISCESCGSTAHSYDNADAVRWNRQVNRGWR